MTPKETHSAVAIVGIALELPSGKHSKQNLDYNTFWEFLLEKRDAYEAVPQERLQELMSGFSVEGTFLKDITNFDNVEFGMSNKDATGLVMSSRKLVELSFLAMLDSGIEYRGKRFGSFMCGTSPDYFGPGTTKDRTVDTPLSTMANRMSYILDITGPSFYVDTACSSSLTAMHLALQAIQNGECEGAIVGGSQINSNLFDWDFYEKAGVLSSDNSCKPFDEGANGFSKAEGAVVVVLKPIEAALAGHDHIYSVILGSSINSNGARASIHAPSGIAQQECIKEAFAKAGRDPTEVDFVELHATGTSVGDPIEANAAGEIFARDESVIIGSVKGNTGHVESTAFLTSLAKVCLMLEHRIIPPNAHFSEPNPKISWDRYRLQVATLAIPLGCRSSTGRSLISMASSGIGGSNGHIVFESPPPPSSDPPSMSPETPVLFVIGGLSPKTVQSLSESVVQMLSADSSFEALSQAVKLARRARQLPWRTHFTYYPRSKSFPSILKPVLTPKTSPPVILVFTGQGPQHIHMARSLFRTYKIFRDTILELDAVHIQATNTSLIKSTGLFAGEYSTLSGTWSAETTIPALTMVQIALLDLLQSIGLRPDAVFGHSAGETALVYASGAGSKAMAVEIAIARGKAMKLAETVGGGMMALGCNLSTALRILAKAKEASEGVLEIACHNSPEAFVLSGHAALIEEALKVAQAEGIFARRLYTLTASHSAVMDVCKEKYIEGITKVFSRYPGPCKPILPTFSAVSGHDEMITEFTPDYFWQNMRRAVHFQETVETVAEEYPNAAFVEISPHPVLSSYIFASAQRDAVCPMRREKDGSASNIELSAFTQAIGELFMLRVNCIDLTSIYGHASRNIAYNIPYPFTSRHFPMRIGGPRLSGSVEANATSVVLIKMNSKLFPDLAQHIINGTKIVPATAFIDMVVQSGARVLWDVEFKTILSLESQSPVDVRVERDHKHWSLVTTQGNEVRVHSKGFWSSSISSGTSSIDIVELRARLKSIELKGFYDALLPLIEFGPDFKRVEYLAGGPSEWFAQINGTIKPHSEATYKFHPVLLDACLHFVLHPDIAQPPSKDVIFLPHKLGRFTFCNSPTLDGPIYSRAELVDWTPESRVYDLDVYDATGTCLCRMHRMELRQIFPSPPIIVNSRYELIYQPVTIDIPIKPLEKILVTGDGDYMNLYRILDQLAQGIINTSLAAEPEVGKSDRARQLTWAKRAAAKVVSSAPLAVDADTWRLDSPQCFEITKRLSEIYPQTFSSTTPAREALFSDDLMSNFFQNHFKSLLEYTTSAFEEIVAQMSSRGKRALKVLEIGAGTGTLSQTLTNALKRNTEIVAEYYITDVSFDIASKAALTCSHPHVIPKALELSKSLEEQDFTPGSADIVTTFYALHTTPNISQSLAVIHDMLSPGGCFLAIELDGNAWEQNDSPEKQTGALWHDFLFGCFAEWHGATDSRVHCTMTSLQWESALARAGFCNIQFTMDSKNSLGFTFSAQKSSQNPPSLTLATRTDASFFTFMYGEEVRLQEHLYCLDLNKRITLWLLASEGRDGDVASGLTPTLAREFSHWNVCTAVFPDTIPEESDRIRCVLQHWDHIVEEQIVHFNEDGKALVAKVAPLAPPPTETAVFDPNGPWISDGSTIKQAVKSPLNDGEVNIDVLAWSKEHNSWRGFVGSVVESRATEVVVGNHYVGIKSASSVSNNVNCEVNSLARVAKLDASLAEDALPMVIVASSLGPGRIADFGNAISSLRILFPTVSEESLLFARFFKSPAFNAQVTLGAPSEADRFTLIVVDSSTANTHPELESWLVPKLGNLFVWDSFLQHESENKPWNIGYFLSSALKFRDSRRSSEAELIRPLALVKVLPTAVPQLPLFSAEKAYIILGGASDLGVQMSLWMYRKGARNIVLSSRRGPAFFAEASSAITNKKLRYLEGRPDLRLRVVSFDATSPQETAAFSQTVDVAIGGCFIATLVMMDAMFISQKPETYHIVSDLKHKVYTAFTSAFNVEDLDFLVSLSSMIPILGNPGQSSYAAGNALLDGALSKRHNAFSMMLPAISGVGYFDRLDVNIRSDLEGWSFNPDDICASIEDALLKLKRGDRFSCYIPGISWNIIERDSGLPPSCRHLIWRNEPVRQALEVSQAGETNHGGLDQILEIIFELLDISETDFSPILPFTSFGLDSLGATRISAALRPYLQISQMQLLGGISWEQLQDRVKDAGKVKTPVATQISNVEVMNEMVTKYTQDFGVHKGVSAVPAKEVVWISGTTGSIGSYVLAELMNSSNISHVYAFNRKSSSSMVDRQRQALQDRGLDGDLVESSRLTLVEGDLSRADLGVEDFQLLEQMRILLTHIIHIAWRVDFNLDLPALEDQIQGVRNLIDFTLSSPHATPPRMLFLSSPTILHGYLQPEAFAEIPVKVEYAAGFGYGESKWVAERILAVAAANTALRPIILRAAQVSGGINGYWKPAEWIPSIILSAHAVKSLPLLEQEINLIPLDLAAKAIVDLHNSSSEIVHVTHPYQATQWNMIFGHASTVLNVPLVPFNQWIAQLEESESSHSAKENPALRLLDHYRRIAQLDDTRLEAAGMARFATDISRTESSVLGDPNMRRVDVEEVQKWLYYWKLAGLLSF